MTKVLVTGANGFVGQALCPRLQKQGLAVIPVARRADLPDGMQIDITGTTDWRQALVGIDMVVHLSARVHVLNDASADPLQAYRKANVETTLNLARQCVDADIKRFVYLSSIKVNGEATTDRPFSVIDTPHPTDPYGISKLEAEQGLRQIAVDTGLEVVIIRPPLVYGPNVKANFLQLMRWVKRGIPLPLASIHNQRDMVFVGNLVDLIAHCCAHPAAAGQTFLVSDQHSVSTADLLHTVAVAMGRKASLLPVPPFALLLAARLVGRQAVAQRLLESLQVDIGHTVTTLDWTPPYSFEEGVRYTVEHFLTVGK